MNIDDQYCGSMCWQLSNILVLTQNISPKKFWEMYYWKAEANALSMLIKRDSQLQLPKDSCKAMKIAVWKGYIFLLLAEVYDNYTYIIKCEQAMDVKRLEQMNQSWYYLIYIWIQQKIIKKQQYCYSTVKRNLWNFKVVPIEA